MFADRSLQLGAEQLRCRRFLRELNIGDLLNSDFTGKLSGSFTVKEPLYPPSSGKVRMSQLTTLHPSAPTIQDARSIP